MVSQNVWCVKNIYWIVLASPHRRRSKQRHLSSDDLRCVDILPGYQLSAAATTIDLDSDI